MSNQLEKVKELIELRAHPDHVPPGNGLRTGKRQPDTGMHQPAHAPVQGKRHRRVSGGTRDQGGGHCGPADAGAHGGRGAVFRGRPAAGVPPAAGGEEPLWLGK